MGVAAITMEKPCWGEVPSALSVTCTIKVYVPAVVGVPEIVPVGGSKASPGGRVPPVLAQVAEPVIGAASRVAE